jgi:hypothetical protein
MADRSRFAKTVTVLAVVFGIGLGLCGLSYILPSSDNEFHTNWLSGVSLLVIVLSFLGLVVSLIIWAIRGIIGSSTERTSATQTLFGDSEEEHKDRDQPPRE